MTSSLGCDVVTFIGCPTYSSVIARQRVSMSFHGMGLRFNGTLVAGETDILCTC